MYLLKLSLTIGKICANYFNSEHAKERHVGEEGRRKNVYCSVSVQCTYVA